MNMRINRQTHSRRGAVAPLMAIMIPVLLMLCGFVVNIAYMQLNRTQLRVATDAAARAAGRAFSEFQDQEDDTVQIAIDYAVSTAAMNQVGAKQVQLNPAENSSSDPDALDEITFGLSDRLDNGYGRYTFDAQDRTAVRNKTQKATSIRIVGRRTNDSLGGSIQMLFAGWGPFSEFEPVVASTTTQVDRDIALVLDRSGSMLEYKDWPSLETHAQQLYDQGKISYNEWYYGGRENTTIGYRTYPYRSWQGYPVNAYQNDRYWHLYEEGHIDEFEYAKDMRDRASVNQNGRANQYGSTSPAPRHSRWAQLEVAVDEFLKVLEETDQEERVSLISFNTSGSKNLGLTARLRPDPQQGEFDLAQKRHQRQRRYVKGPGFHQESFHKSVGPALRCQNHRGVDGWYSQYGHHAAASHGYATGQ